MVQSAGHQAPDVAIIGGGIVGTAAAALLAEAGARVTLYEREALAAGASGRNSGVVQHPFDPALVPLHEETVGLYRRIGESVPEAGFCLSDEPAGLLLASRDVPTIQGLAARLARAYPRLRPAALVGDDLRRLEPALHPEVAACRLEMGYPVIPSAPTYAFAALAERHGVVIRQGRSARPAVEGDRCVGVEVGGRLEPAGAVIVAAGPWTPEVLDPTGRWRPIRPVWGVVVETLFGRPPQHVIEEAEIEETLGTGDVEAGRGDEAAAPPESEALADAAGSAAGGASSAAPEAPPEFSLVTAGGVSVVGSTFLLQEPDPAGWTERLLARAAEFVPTIADAPIRGARVCARPGSPDGRPLIGAVPWLDGAYIAAGHGPWGISTGPGTARLVADLVLGRAVAIDPAFAVGRFGRGTV